MMVHMSREQVLSWGGWADTEWPSAGADARKMSGEAWGKTNWRWGLSGSNDEAILFSDFNGSISRHDIASRQGDPNAHESVRASEKPAEWDGEGVPAAGTLIEVLPDIHHRSSRNVVVVGFDSTLKRVVFRDLDWSDLEYDSALLERVRPIRSERDQMIDDVLELLDCTGINTLTLADMASALYDAGYRKTEGA